MSNVLSLISSETGLGEIWLIEALVSEVNCENFSQLLAFNEEIEIWDEEFFNKIRNCQQFSRESF